MENEVKTKKPVYKKWWFWLIIGLVAVGTVGAIAGGTSGSSGTGGGGSQTQTTEHKMNETVKIGDLECIVNSAYNIKKIGSVGTVTQNNYVVVNTTVKNTGSTEMTLTSSSFSYYIGNNKYEPSAEGIYLTNGFCVVQDLGAGITKNISVVFEIPSEYQPSDYLQVKSSYHTEKIYMK